MERERAAGYTIQPMTLEDGEDASAFLKRMHQETYANQELGVTKEALGERFERRTKDERQERLRQRLENPDNQAFVAKENNTIVGFVAPRIDEDGVRRVGALYVDKNWQGKGLAHDLMQKVIEWHDGTKNDIELHVVTYNERAKAFYRKWGFREVPNSENMYDGLIPEVKMIRKATRRDYEV